MMSKKLEVILNKINIEVNPKSCVIDWKTQDSKENSLLFYELKDQTKDQIELAKRRIESSKYKYCFVSQELDLGLPRVMGLTSSVFATLKEELLNLIYPYNKSIFCIGVTGTNGKTTTVELIRQLSILNKKNILTIGTLGVYLNDKIVENFNLTSPSYIDFRKTLNKYSDQIEILAMELSSHALVQNRSGSILFDEIGWTNFTQDHLDYHGTMEEYLNSKMLVFEKLKSNSKVSIPESQKELITKINRSKNIKQVSVGETLKNPFFKMNYNLDNLSIAKSCLSGIHKIHKSDMEKLKAPDGRFNIFPYQDSYIVIDYAHTPDALESICCELKTSFPNHRLITVFGCGGNRDKTKRPEMAKAAEKYSDKTIVTSDNPRFEDPDEIIKDIKIGFSKEHVTISDRKEAIAFGMKSLQKSILLIAGKGHENYIDQNGMKLPYSDYSQIQEILK